MFRFDEEYSYRMPPHFGGVKGSGLENLRYDDVTCVSLSYLTDIDAVSKYIPDVFEIMDPVLNLSYQKCCGVRWMGGGEYSLIAVMTPARHLPTGTEGAYILVIWENKTAPILGGREEMAGVDPTPTLVEVDAKATSQTLGSLDQENADDFAITLAICRLLCRQGREPHLRDDPRRFRSE